MAVDVLKLDIVVLPGLIEVFCSQTHASIGALFGIGQEGKVDHSIVHGLKEGLATRVKVYLAAFGFQGQGTQELGVAGVGADDAFITAWRGGFRQCVHNSWGCLCGYRIIARDLFLREQGGG